MAKFDPGVTFTDGDTVTAASLNNIVDTLNIYSGLIADQTAIAGTVSTADLLLLADTDQGAAGAANKVTAQKLFTDVLTNGTFASVNLTDNLTYGTATGNRTVSTSAVITNGTITTGVIPTGTFGTTTSTAATITTGTIPTLTAGTTTGTAGIFTSGTIATLNSTTGTVGNLSTTLAGDFTISQGTGTLGTTGATLGTYGGSTSVPVLAINAKGQVTSTGTAAITSGLTGFRNRIINGDMRIDQRNAGASVTASAGYTLDRWYAEENTDGALTVQKSTTAPSGYSNSIICTTTTADASLGATQLACIAQYIEGFNVSDLAWGTASAKTVTLSFWVRSSLTGTFGGSFKNSASNRSYPFSYSISVANTWENKTITVAGDTSGTWLSDSGIGIGVFFGLGVGSTYSGTAGAWTGSNLISTTGAVSVIGTLNATFYITGVQLEEGSTATDFERRPIGTELALCQRYYEIGGGSNVILFSGNVTNASTYFHNVYFKVEKRSAPTATTATNVNALSFPATDSVVGATTRFEMRLQRVANASSVGYFGDSWTASSEL